VSFLSLSLITISVTGFIAYNRATAALTEAVYNQLNAASTIKAEELSRWVGEQIQETLFIASLPEVLEQGKLLAANDESSEPYRSAYTRLSALLAYIDKNKDNIQEISILSNVGGKILISTNKSQEGQYRVNDRYYVEGRWRTFVQNVYPSPVTGKPTMTIATPMLDATGQPIVVLAVHINLERMDAIVLQKTSTAETTSETYLVDKVNMFVYAERFGSQEFARGVHSTGIDAAVKGQDGQDLYANYAGVPVIGVYKWLDNLELALIAEMSQDEAFQPARQLALVILIVGLVIAVLLVIAVYFVARRLISPVYDLVHGAERIAQDNLDQPVPVRSHDELGMLARAFNSMQDGLRQFRLQREEYARTLEQQVTERTKTLERRAAQISAGAEVARVATTLLDQEKLITRVVQLIQERFEFYYVALFLLDAEKRYAVLQYGIGAATAKDAGRIMKERGHKLQVGERSMIGWTCAHKQARIALDVGQDAVRFANPLLPDTHSEMALPLRVGDQIIGALSVQSTQVAAFDDSDIAALQGMADQIAVALQNARLFQQTEATLKELETTNRLLMREGWAGYLAQPAAAHKAEFRTSQPAGTGPLVEPLVVPLEMRGQSFGRLTVRREGSRAWSTDEVEMLKTIAQQAVLAADNTRLMEQTQIALRESDGLYKATELITRAATIQEICQTLVTQSSTLIQPDRTVTFLVDHTHQQITHAEGYGNVTDDLQTSYAELQRGISGMVFQSGEPILSLSADDGIEPEETRERRIASDVGAVIVVPLVIKGEVIGTVTALNRITQRKFTQHDVELLSTMAAQASTAIESQRLFEDARRRAEREQLIRQITTRIRAAGDIQGILQTTAIELAQTMRVPRAVVRLTPGEK
jgi:GAF domain-containing protein/HAMP domain-containing protein